jgi:hypothetical protein
MITEHTAQNDADFMMAYYKLRDLGRALEDGSVSEVYHVHCRFNGGLAYLDDDGEFNATTPATGGVLRVDVKGHDYGIGGSFIDMQDDEAKCVALLIKEVMAATGWDSVEAVTNIAEAALDGWKAGFTDTDRRKWDARWEEALQAKIADASNTLGM